MRVVRAVDARREPWRNGAGWTSELARSPEGAGEYDWRLSVADVETDGPFSAFTGCDRILVLLDGAGMRLRLDAEEVTLGRRLDSIRFAGEQAVAAELIAGATRDLNLIWRRDACSVELHRHDGDSGRDDVAVGGAPGQQVVAYWPGTGDAEVGDRGEAWTPGRDGEALAFLISFTKGT